MGEDRSDISVLMSVYHKEQPTYLKLAIDSMLAQTLSPAEVLIVEDGPLTPELCAVLDGYADNPLVRRLPLKENVGLGLAMKTGVENCRFPFIARMDSDDYSLPERLRLQRAAFEEHPELDVLGTQMEEFVDEPDKVIAVRRVPLEHEAILRFQKMRSAFNHISVMLRKEAVLRAGNYEDAPYMEDDVLWANMFQKGCRAANLEQSLVKARVSSGMYDRRGGFLYFRAYKAARKTMMRRGQISYFEYLSSSLAQLAVALMPQALRKLIYMKILRR